MSFNPRTEIEKLLCGVSLTPRTRLGMAIKTAMDSVASAVELPTVSSSDNGKVLGVDGGKWKKTNAVLYIPVTVTMDGTTPVATTTATFNDVKKAVAAKQDVRCEVTLPNSGGIVYGALTYIDAATPTVIEFDVVIDSGGESAAPTQYHLAITSSGVTIRVNALALASD